MLLASSCSNPFTSKSDSNNQSDKTDVTIEFPAELFRSISAGRGVEEESNDSIVLTVWLNIEDEPAIGKEVEITDFTKGTEVIFPDIRVGAKVFAYTSITIGDREYNGLSETKEVTAEGIVLEIELQEVTYPYDFTAEPTADGIMLTLKDLPSGVNYAVYSHVIHISTDTGTSTTYINPVFSGTANGGNVVLFDQYVSEGDKREYCLWVNYYQYCGRRTATATGGVGNITLSATPTDQGIRLFFESPLTDAYYKIGRICNKDGVTVSNTNMSLVSGIKAFTDTYVDPDSEYIYFVMATPLNNSGYTPMSNDCIVTATGGLGELRITNKPVATFDYNTKSLMFSQKPIIKQTLEQDDGVLSFRFNYKVPDINWYNADFTLKEDADSVNLGHWFSDTNINGKTVNPVPNYSITLNEINTMAFTTYYTDCYDNLLDTSGLPSVVIPEGYSIYYLYYGDTILSYNDCYVHSVQLDLFKEFLNNHNILEETDYYFYQNKIVFTDDGIEKLALVKDELSEIEELSNINIPDDLMNYYFYYDSINISENEGIPANEVFKNLNQMGFKEEVDYYITQHKIFFTDTGLDKIFLLGNDDGEPYVAMLATHYNTNLDLLTAQELQEVLALLETDEYTIYHDGRLYQLRDFDAIHKYWDYEENKQQTETTYPLYYSNVNLQLSISKGALIAQGFTENLDFLMDDGSISLTENGLIKVLDENNAFAMLKRGNAFVGFITQNEYYAWGFDSQEYEKESIQGGNGKVIVNLTTAQYDYYTGNYDPTELNYYLYYNNILVMNMALNYEQVLGSEGLISQRLTTDQYSVNGSRINLTDEGFDTTWPGCVIFVYDNEVFIFVNPEAEEDQEKYAKALELIGSENYTTECGGRIFKVNKTGYDAYMDAVFPHLSAETTDDGVQLKVWNLPEDEKCFRIYVVDPDNPNNEYLLFDISDPQGDEPYFLEDIYVTPNEQISYALSVSGFQAIGPITVTPTAGLGIINFIAENTTDGVSITFGNNYKNLSEDKNIYRNELVREKDNDYGPGYRSVYDEPVTENFVDTFVNAGTEYIYSISISKYLYDNPDLDNYYSPMTNFITITPTGGYGEFVVQNEPTGTIEGQTFVFTTPPEFYVSSADIPINANYQVQFIYEDEESGYSFYLIYEGSSQIDISDWFAYADDYNSCEPAITNTYRVIVNNLQQCNGYYYVENRNATNLSKMPKIIVKAKQ